MRLSQELRDQIVAHAQADAPDECCGLVSSTEGTAVTVYPIENTAHSPLRYEMHPIELLKASNAVDDADLEIGAIYHSHTRSAPYPSQTDINLAFYPDALYIIVGLASGPEPELKAYEIRDGRVAEAVLTVV